MLPLSIPECSLSKTLEKSKKLISAGIHEEMGVKVDVNTPNKWEQARPVIREKGAQLFPAEQDRLARADSQLFGPV